MSDNAAEVIPLDGLFEFLNKFSHDKGAIESMCHMFANMSKLESGKKEIEAVIYSKRLLNEFFVNLFPGFVDMMHKRRPRG